MGGTIKRVGALVGIGFTSLNLSGCIVAAAGQAWGERVLQARSGG